MERAADESRPIAKAVRILERLDGPDQHRARVAVSFGDRVEAVMHPVDQINVGDAGFPVHERSAPLWPTPRVRCRVVRPNVRLRLNNAASASQVAVDVDERFSEEL